MAETPEQLPVEPEDPEKPEGGGGKPRPDHDLPGGSNKPGVGPRPDQGLPGKPGDRPPTAQPKK